jgi:hypothetical protein
MKGGEIMKIKNILVGTTASLLMYGAFAASAFAAPAQHLNWGSQFNPSACNSVGTPIVNVNYKILNDGDTQPSGQFWAMDNYNRNLKIFDQGNNTYCAVVSEVGNFVATGIGSALPVSDNTYGPLDSGVTGTVEGGYTGLITGTFAPTVPTHGKLPTSNYNCNVDPSCSAAFDWVGAYFPGGGTVANLYTNWGWVYHAGDNGSMVQAAPSTYTGNILNN